MKRRIFGSLVLLSTVAALLAGAFSSVLYYRLYARQAKLELRTIASLVTRDQHLVGGDYSDLIREALSAVEYDLRVTVVDSSGKVLADSHADPSTLEEHGSRPEIREALESGTGEELRHSDTLSQDTYYYTLRLPDGRVARFSRPINSIYAIFFSTLPALCFVLAAVFLLAWAVARMLTGRILAPVEGEAQHLKDSLLDGVEYRATPGIYEELSPFVLTIRQINQELDQHIDELKRERDAIGVITENMHEGLILLDREMKVLSINSGARQFLGEETAVDKGRHILEYTRDLELIDHIRTAMETGDPLSFDQQRDGRYDRYFISPVQTEDGALSGALVLIVDITREKQADIARREFTSNVSHELKTPLTTIKGFGEMLDEGLITKPADVKKYGGLINQESVRLLGMINDLLRLSRIEEGAGVSLSKVNLRDCAQRAQQQLARQIEERGVTVTVEGDAVLRADGGYLDELVFNLLENAVKYNKAGGRVEIQLGTEGRSAVLTVKDTGVGIPEGDQARVFERFYRVDPSRSKDRGGSGLGLAIVKHIVELFGGAIDLQSQVGEGTEITVRIPIREE